MESNFRQAFGYVRGRARDRAGKIFEVSGRLGRRWLVGGFGGDATLIGLGAFWDEFPR